MKSIVLCAALLTSAALCASASAHTVPAPVAMPAATAPATVPASASPASPAAPVVVAKADDDTLVCERVKELGSTRLKRVCKTIGQREREREAARNAADHRPRGR